MADDAIRPARNHFLVGLDSNGGGSETVRLQDPKHHQAAAKNECLRENRQPQGQVRPAKSVVETGEQIADQPSHEAELYD